MKKRIILVSVLIVLSGVLLTFLFNNEYHNKNINIVSSNSSFAINVFDEESNTYVPQDSVPIGYYDIDEELTYCENGGQIKSYDNVNGQVTIRGSGQDKCYLYFFSFGERVLASTTAAYNNPNSFASKILFDNGGESSILVKGNPDFSKTAPVLTYVDGEFSANVTLETNKNYYYTYSNSYYLNPSTGKFTLKNDDGNGHLTDVTLDNNVIKYSDSYENLVGMYVGSRGGSSTNTLFSYLGLDMIYKITSATATTITYQSLTSIAGSEDNSNDGMYATDDDYTAITGKKSYYYRGAVDNNWVYYAGYYWRIIRINGDGSIRMIYSGSTAPTQETKSVMTGTGTQLPNTIAFNSTTPATAECVGWKYTLGEGHGTSVSSTIKGDDTSPAVGSIDEWYYSNIANNNLYLSKVSQNQILCNDRTAYANPSGTILESAIGTSSIVYFGSFLRVRSNHEPILECLDARDKFTVDGVVTGNESLAYPVGLITADEALMAGIAFAQFNMANYLYTDEAYWTLSPHFNSSSNIAQLLIVGQKGYLSNRSAVNKNGTRPVISLKSDVVVTGTGQWNDPYVV